MTDKDERRKQRNRLSAKKSYWSKKHERRQLEKTHEKEERRQIVLHGEVTKLRQYAQHLEYVIQTADHSQHCRAKAPRVLVTHSAGPQQSECRPQFSASASTVAGLNTVGTWEQTEYNRQSTNSDVHCLLTPSNSFTTASELLGFKGSFTPSTKSDLGCALNAQPRSDFDEAEAGSWYTDFTSKASVHFENQTGQSSSAKDNDVFLGLPGFLLDQDSACPPASFVENSQVKNGSKQMGLNAPTEKEISKGFLINGNTQGHFLALPEGTGQMELTAAVCTRSEARFQENTTMAGGSVGRRTPRSLENNAGQTCSVSSHKSVTVTPYPNVGAFPSQPTEKLSVQSTDEFLTPSDVFINTPSSFRTGYPPPSATCSGSREVRSVDPFTTMNTGRSITITEPRTLPPGPEFSSHKADMFTHEKPSLKPDKSSAYWKTSTTTAQQTAQLEPRMGWNQTSAKSAEIAQNSFSLTQEKRTSLIAREASTLPAAMPNGAPAPSSNHTDYLPRSATHVCSGSTEVNSVSPSLSDFLPPPTLSEDSGCAIDHLLSDGKLSRLFEIVENMDSQDLQGRPGLVSVERETASCFKDTQLSCPESDRNLSNGDQGSHFDGHLYQDIHHAPQTVRVGTAANITANTSSPLVKASNSFQVPETLGTECGKPSVTLQDVNIRLKGNFTEGKQT